MTVKLAELNPYFWRSDEDTSGKGYLSFDCPCVRLGKRPACDRRIRNLPTIDGEPAHTGIYRWGFRGSPPDWDTVSLSPSVNYDEEHWHGFIADGVVT